MRRTYNHGVESIIRNETVILVGFRAIFLDRTLLILIK